MIGLAGRDAARGQHQIVVAPRPRSPRRALGIVLQDAEIGDRGAEPVEQRRPADSGWRRRSAAGRGAPGSTISSPVENTATRTRRRTVELGEADRGGERHVLGAAAGRRQHDRAGAHILAGKPAVGAGLSPGGTTTLSPSARTSSCMNTVSAPAGIGAPVKMRIARAAASTAREPWPAVRRSATRAWSPPRHRDRRGAPRSHRPRNCRTAAGRAGARRRRQHAAARAASGTVSVSATG